MMSLFWRYLPASLWVAVVAWAVYGGLTVPNGPKPAIPITPTALVMFFAVGMALVWLFRAQQSRRAARSRRLAEAYSSSELANVDARIRPLHLGATFFAVAGATGSLACVLSGASRAHLSFALMPLMAGAGMFVSLGIAHIHDQRRRSA